MKFQVSARPEFAIVSQARPSRVPEAGSLVDSARAGIMMLRLPLRNSSRIRRPSALGGMNGSGTGFRTGLAVLLAPHPEYRIPGHADSVPWNCAGELRAFPGGPLLLGIPTAGSRRRAWWSRCAGSVQSRGCLSQCRLSALQLRANPRQVLGAQVLTLDGSGAHPDCRVVAAFERDPRTRHGRRWSTNVWLRPCYGSGGDATGWIWSGTRRATV